MKDVEEEDGLLDKALAFSKPSDVMLCNPFKVATEVDDEHFDMTRDESPELVDKYIKECKEMLNSSREALLKEQFKVIFDIQQMEKEDFDAKVKAIVPPSDLAPHQVLAHAVTAMALEKVDLSGAVTAGVDHALQKLIYPLQDGFLDVDLGQAKNKVKALIKQAGQLGIADDKGASSCPSHDHFVESISNLKTLFSSYVALNAQYTKAVAKHEEYVDSLTNPALTEAESDKYIKLAAAASERADGLKKLRDHKMVNIYQYLEAQYPDIAGSAQNAQQKQKPIAMHSLELDSDLLTGKMDHAKMSF